MWLSFFFFANTQGLRIFSSIIRRKQTYREKEAPHNVWDEAEQGVLSPPTHIKPNLIEHMAQKVASHPKTDTSEARPKHGAELDQ